MKLGQTTTDFQGLAPLPPAPTGRWVSSPDRMLQARRPQESGDEPRSLMTPALPDPAICRGKPAGFGEYVDCLVERPYQCPHALSIGFGHLCSHPDRAAIVRRTAT